mmetsp:Transcript_50624/g.134814  ORF Transcript_50624/g.134814 Transcript_50624/m.134814 type:complete len:120 (-) Transcript_50624:5287-5646(-)
MRQKPPWGDVWQLGLATVDSQLTPGGEASETLVQRCATIAPSSEEKPTRTFIFACPSQRSSRFDNRRGSNEVELVRVTALILGTSTCSATSLSSNGAPVGTRGTYSCYASGRRRHSAGP